MLSSQSSSNQLFFELDRKNLQEEEDSLKWILIKSFSEWKEVCNKMEEIDDSVMYELEFDMTILKPKELLF